MCNGHKFVKSSLFHSPGYLADLSPYITAVISSRPFATPIQITANAIKPLGPLASSILPARATSYILNSTLTCEFCMHQVSQECFDDGTKCPSLLLEELNLHDSNFVLADQLLEVQERRKVDFLKNSFEEERLQNNIDISAQLDSCSSIPKDSTSASSKHDASATVLVKKQHRLLQNEARMYKNDLLILRICPEIGLHAQGFVCNDCDQEIDLATSRLCDYDGRYYCFNCHTGSDYSPIPARILRNWDFTQKLVSKTSLQKISFLRTKPVLFNLFQINSMLYGFIDRLVDIKQLREKIQFMLEYIEVCGQPEKPHLMNVPKHFIDSNLLNFFTINDLVDINQVYDVLNQLQARFKQHIVRDCESCRGKGYYCELCHDPHDVLYPFSQNSANCSKCRAVYHKNCFHRKKKHCPRCTRLKMRNSTTKKDDET